MRKSIIYPGNSKQPCVAEFEIKHTSENYINHTKVMIYDLYDKNPGGTCAGYSEVCEHIVNQILRTEFNGVRLDFIEFYYVWKNNGEEVISEIQYSLDPVTYIQDGGKHKGIYSSTFKQFKSWLITKLGGIVIPDRIEYLSHDVTAGTGVIRVTNDPVLCVTKESV